jgi:sulfite exporter TauE/SafE
MTLPVDALTLTAAFVSGLLGSVHCAAMCGGIATGLSAASAPAAGARASLDAAAALNVGRVGGYVIAGALVGLIGSGARLVIDVAAWQTGLRVALGVVLMLIALRVAGIGDRWNALSRIGAPLWRMLSPLQRRLVPAITLPRRLLLGMLWGWLPCGLSGSLLLVAWLEADAVHGALVMAAFGAGTLPAMLPLTWSGARAGLLLAGSAKRRAFAALIFTAGLVTALAPWLMRVPELHSVLAVLGCRSL